MVALCRTHGIATRKRLGQNFLVDANVLAKILAAADLTVDDLVLEIGAGLGTLTRVLAGRAGRVIAIEKDPRCFAALTGTTQELANVERLMADALAVDLRSLAEGAHRIKVVANLPYNLSKPVLQRLFDLRDRVERAVLMLQQEVALRLIAQPGSKDYGPLAIAAQLFADTRVVATVSPNSFFPPPRVRSTLVRLDFLSVPRLTFADEAWYFQVVNAALRERRKTLANALASRLKLKREQISRGLTTAGLDGTRRGETLSPAEFGALATALRSPA